MLKFDWQLVLSDDDDDDDDEEDTGKNLLYIYLTSFCFFDFFLFYSAIKFRL